VWLPKGSFRTLKTELRKVLKGWKECPRVEMKWEINYGVRKDSKSSFRAKIPGELQFLVLMILYAIMLYIDA